MRYAFLSDIHANPSALERVLADTREQGADKVICLGDIVGYGPDPVGALQLCREGCDINLMGNHDAAVAGLTDFRNFIPFARDGVIRHRDLLTPEQRGWLGELPYLFKTRTFYAVHGSLKDPPEFAYILYRPDARAAFSLLGRKKLLFVGHTHEAMWIEEREGGEVVGHDPYSFTLQREKRYIVNVGSVGYPRILPESTYVIYDSRRKTIAYRHLPFDFKGYAKEMETRDIPLPRWLEKSLATVPHPLGSPPETPA